MTGKVPREAVSVFVDVSNIFIGARHRAEFEGEWRSAVRLDATNLDRFLRAGRSRDGGAVVVNAQTPAAAIRSYGQLGHVLVCEPGRNTGSEQANDETLLVRMYETVHSKPPGILVLATGDGAGSSEHRGFIQALEAARQKHWRIELVSWTGSTNRRLSAWVKRTGNVWAPLDDAYYSVTFIEGGRRAQAMSLKHRPMTHIHVERPSRMNESRPMAAVPGTS